MSERKYEVIIDDVRIASDMTIEDALIFVKAYFEEYYNEYRMMLSIREMERVGENADSD